VNRSFELVEFFSGRKATFYTVLFVGEDLTEGDKFLNNEMIKQNRAFADLKHYFFNMLEKTGAERHFFKHEGLQHDMVRAYHVRRENLRWYCVYWNRNMVVFGNGGVKRVAKTQDDEHLKESEYAMRWVSQCIDKAAKDGRFSVDYDGKIHGMKNFNDLYF
jgi:hypothetical protein